MTIETLQKATEIQNQINTLTTEANDWKAYRYEPDIDDGYGIVITYWRNNNDRCIKIQPYTLMEIKEERLKQIEKAIKQLREELEAL
jgi:hypothetical protein